MVGSGEERTVLIESANIDRKGIILAGGSGTRLYPLTLSVSKQLMPVYDKPMIYYPLATLMLAGIREILVITTPHEQERFVRLLDDGSQWGISICYAQQDSPDGLAQAFIIGEKFIGNSSVCLILGDNIFYGHGFAGMLQSAVKTVEGATVFAYYVRNPERYGVVVMDESGNPVDIVEKPQTFLSNYVVSGLYFYDNEVVSVAKQLQPSVRGELEITDVNRAYLKRGKLLVKLLGRGMAWLDVGTHESLLQAANFIEVLESRQGLKISCPEEVAYRMGYIDAVQLENLARPLINSGYGKYLMDILELREIDKKRQ